MKAPAFPRLGRDLIEPLRMERGYVLPMHHVIGSVSPVVLQAYGTIYRAAAFESPADGITREVVWLALLATEQGDSFRNHLARAEEAGLSADDASWLTSRFANVEQAIGSLPERVPPSLSGARYALAAMAVSAAYRRAGPFEHWLNQAEASGADTLIVCQSLLPVLLAAGAGSLNWACHRWADLAHP